MKFATMPALIIPAAFLAAATAASADEIPAKYLFSGVTTPAPLAPQPVGYYARGCLAGAVALPPDGPDWQAMRLSRNRNWGTPQLVAFVKKLARDTKAKDGWPGLLVGDLGQPRGGPTPTDHSSHQNGLDVDIWFAPMPYPRLSVDERENMTLQSVLVPGSHYEVDMIRFPEGLDRVLKRAASYPEVQRILVNPGVKKILCDRAGRDRAWLSKIRPWYKHDDHMHVRLRCPPGLSSCRAQKPPPSNDGCGVSLAYWLSPLPWKQRSAPKKPTPSPQEIMLSDLPAACADILAAESVTLSPASENQKSRQCKRKFLGLCR
jgi:penicillin-insensitive murein endopeptidase